jgi:hypothetical protein
LLGVVNYHCQLVCELAVGAAHDEIADVALHRLLDIALHTVHETYRLGRGPHA